MRMSNLRLSSTARCNCDDEDEENEEDEVNNDDEEEEEFEDVGEDYDHQGGKCGGQ